MTLKKNILFSYLGSCAIAVVPVLALPYYLAALGPQQFGLISFVSMLQVVMGLFDAGFSQAMVREFAMRFDHPKIGKNRAALLLFGFERLYWFMALAVGGLAFILSGFIAAFWLGSGTVPGHTAQLAVCGAVAIFVVQLPGSIYRSALAGTRAFTQLNCAMLFGIMLRHVVGVIVVAHWPTLFAYLVWQTCAALLETLIRRWLSWEILGKRPEFTRWQWAQVKPVWLVAAGMSGATMLGAAAAHVDKLALSRMVPMDQFGYYAIASAVSLGALQLIYPLMQAMLPHIVGLREDPVALRKLNFKLALVVSMLTLAGAVVFLGFGPALLNLWLRNTETASKIFPLMAALLTGTALNAYYNIGYVSWLSQGATRKILFVNFASLVPTVLALPLLILHFGAMGAAYGWLGLNLIGLIFSLEWVRRGSSERPTP